MVVRQPNPDITVYNAKQCDEGVERTLHRNLLLSIDYLHDPSDEDPVNIQKKERTTEAQEDKADDDISPFNVSSDDNHAYVMDDIDDDRILISEEPLAGNRTSEFQ